MAVLVISTVALISLLAIAAAIRGWDIAAPLFALITLFMMVIVPTSVIKTVFFVWAVLNVAVLALAIWFGARGRKSLANFMENLFHVKIANWIEEFRMWNQ